MKRYLAVFLFLCLLCLGGFTVSAKAELGTGKLRVGGLVILGIAGMAAVMKRFSPRKKKK